MIKTTKCLALLAIVASILLRPAWADDEKLYFEPGVSISIPQDWKIWSPEHRDLVGQFGEQGRIEVLGDESGIEANSIFLIATDPANPTLSVRLSARLHGPDSILQSELQSMSPLEWFVIRLSLKSQMQSVQKSFVEYSHLVSSSEVISAEYVIQSGLHCWRTTVVTKYSIDMPDNQSTMQMCPTETHNLKTTIAAPYPVSLADQQRMNEIWKSLEISAQ